MAKTKKPEDKAAYKVYATLAAIVAAFLLVVSGLAWWAYSFTTDMVRTELSAQKIYFPEKGSPALDPEQYPGLQQYAGQLVDDGYKAKAYANEYIGIHLQNTADGKVYSEVSTELRQDPTNEELQAQRESLFMGETLRGILLGNGYAFWVIGKIAQIASVIAFLLAVILAGASAVFAKRARRS